MTSILRIDSSARPVSGGSCSRVPADQIVAHLQDRQPSAQIISRDLAAAPLPHIVHETIQGFYTPPEQLPRDLDAALATIDVHCAG